MMKNKITLLIFLLALIFSVSAQTKKEKIKIWKNVDNKELKKQKSTLTVFYPEEDLKNGAAVIICPGGSYHHLGMSHEGYKTAEWLNSIGVTAFVLRYRVSFFGHHNPAMIEDLQRSIQIVRENADDFGVNSDEIGVMGYSAGGHLVLMAGAFYNENFLEKKGLKTDVSLRPDFVISIYPVVSMQDSIAHKKSRRNLLGKNFTQEDIDKYSIEKQITQQMPPVYLQASKDDSVVNYKNSIVLNKSLTEHNINHKCMIYDTGGHGYGMKKTEFTTKTKWNWIIQDWLIDIGIIKK